MADPPLHSNVCSSLSGSRFDRHDARQATWGPGWPRTDPWTDRSRSPVSGLVRRLMATEAVVRHRLMCEALASSEQPSEAVCEFWVPRSNERADLVLINGEMSGFEIKTVTGHPQATPAPGCGVRPRVRSLHRRGGRAPCCRCSGNAARVVGGDRDHPGRRGSVFPTVAIAGYQSRGRSSDVGSAAVERRGPRCPHRTRMRAGSAGDSVVHVVASARVGRS